MVVAPLPVNEADRLAALYACQILDTLPESDYDSLVFLAAQICDTPLALISLIDAKRQWFKSTFGIEPGETSRDTAFCAHAILRPHEVMVVPDAREDRRFADNPAVLGHPNVRFYAGAPIVVHPTNSFIADGPFTSELAIGTICVVGHDPRELTPEQERALKELARQVSRLLDLRLHRMLDAENHRRLQETASRLEESERRLKDAQEIAHIGSWEYYVNSGKVSWSREMYRLLWLDPERSEPNFGEMLMSFHPDDVKAHLPSMEKALEDGQPFELDLRAVHPDGNYRWLHMHGQGVIDDEGNVTGLFGTLQDITDQKIAQDALVEMTNNLRMTNGHLQEFTSVASHDMKEPLRKIQTFGGMLRRLLTSSDGGTSEQTLYYTDRMVSASKRLQNLIDGLLTLARVSERATKARYVPVDLKEMAEDVLVDLELAREESGGNILIEELPVVCADPLQMRQLLHNLLSNAMKYRRKDVPLEIRLSSLVAEETQGIAFKVQDNGIGFPEDEADRIFRVFERLENHDCEGTGVGLSICQRIVEAHGGRIRAEGKLNKGAAFIIHLPGKI